MNRAGETTERRQRASSPPLLMTKLHPPPRREQTVMRDRLVERLRAGPGIKLTVVAAPAGSGKTTLLGSWREVEERRAAGRVADPRRGRQRPGRALVVRARGAPRRLSRGSSVSLLAGARRSVANRGHLPAGADQRADRARRCRARSRRLPSALERRCARQRRLVHRPCARRRSSSCSRREASPRCRWRRCAPTGRCSSYAPTTSASRRAEADVLLNDRLELGLERARRRRPRRANRGLAGRALPGRALASGGRGSARAS